MLHLLLADTIPIFFRFRPKYLEISLVVVQKKVGLAKLTLVSSKKNKQRLVKILPEKALAYQVLNLLAVSAAYTSQLFKHVMERIK